MKTGKENLHLLLVDDDPMNLMLLSTVLEKDGYKTTSCLRGSEALQKASEEKFDLILLDIMMPEMMGYDVCTELKKNKKTLDIPVIFITAKSDSESIIQAYESGGQDYITKPFKKNELLARVHTHLSLKIQNDRLKALNKNLDQKVKERTQEIETANYKIKAYAKSLSLSNEELEKKNHKLQNTLDELTKAKISKKAIIFATGTALLLFILSEAIIEPYIETFNDNFYISLGLKSLIVLLFKPIEMLFKFIIKQRANRKQINQKEVFNEILPKFPDYIKQAKGTQKNYSNPAIYS